jgi:hypothetical protein
MIKKVSLPIGEAIQGMETLFAEANAGLDMMLEKIPGGSMGIFAGALGVGAAADAFNAILGGAGGAALGGAAGKAIQGALKAATTFVTSAAFIKAALAGLATYGFIRIVENALGLEGTITNIKNFFTSGFDTQYVPGLQRPGMFSATPQTSNTTLPSNATTVREANTQATMAPVAQMSTPVNNRDLVVQIDGKEVGRVAAKEINKGLSYSYG